MVKVLLIFTVLVLMSGLRVIAAVHPGQLEISTFVGRQQVSRDHNATFSGGLQLGLEIAEVGIIEFSAETGFGSYPEDNQRVRNFDIALKSIIYSGELIFPYIMGGIGLMTFNRTGDDRKDEETGVTFAKTTVNTGFGLKVRIKKSFFARIDQKYFLFSRDSALTYRSLTAAGISYLF